MNNHIVIDAQGEIQGVNRDGGETPEGSNKQILFLGHPGFPVGFGAIQRLLLIAKGVAVNDCGATVISYKGVHSRDHNFAPKGFVEGVEYIYTSGTIYRSHSFWKRNWLKLKGKYLELAYIRRLKKSGRLGGCLVSTMDFPLLVQYWIFFKFLSIPLVLNYDEFNSAIESRKLKNRKINDFLFDHYAPRLASKVTPISDFLIQHVRSLSSSKPILKLPILCDFEKFIPSSRKADNEIRFVYCGSASYQTLIEFVLESFEYVCSSSVPVYLDLILGGKAGEIKQVEQLIEKCSMGEQVRLHGNVPHHQIPAFYASASALLIPLRPTVQDKARFPHKLGEYLASARPVITTAFGEICNYDFNDGETCLVASDFCSRSFGEKMQFVVDKPDKSRAIGIRGREMGLKSFNYKNIGLQLKEFILEEKAEN
ncbi:MAG: glycosyltransferase [Saprospiraceae bacterium]|nr:glycosyltransferase [Saprospiraceae bacterium]